MAINMSTQKINTIAYIMLLPMNTFILKVQVQDANSPSFYGDNIG